MKIIVLGTGSRGNVYTGFAVQNGAEIVAAADINQDRLSKFGEEYKIPSDRLFISWEALFESGIDADAVINSTPDRIHYPSTMAALKQGYHVLLEKPMSPVEQECRDLVSEAEKNNRILMVCHVLRYSPFFEKLKELLDKKAIGDIVNFQMTENVVFWHFAHSFVRGIFRREDLSSPWILAKSCHDLDLIVYLTGKKCLSVTSMGGLGHFISENAPEGAPEYCIDGCPHEETCHHFAPALYMRNVRNVSWPANMISVKTFYNDRYEALKNGPYGRCVYKCDNDVADHQSAIFEMEGGMRVTFNMVGFSSENTRTLRIYGTKGDIRGHLDKGEIEVNSFLSLGKEVIQVDNSTIISSHGGGDHRILKDFLNAVEGKSADRKTTARLSLESHLMAFAAEKARKEKRVVNISY